jgi:ABC-type taurine transport system ATPase subunit
MPYALVGSRAGAVVALKGKQGRFPIGSMGEGMRRLLALATSLAVSKGGSLFVDEIDTGLHYTVMADMWKLVVKAARDTGVQVFATTHSWDCIEGLAYLCNREPGLMEQVAIHKIDRALPNSVAFAGSSIVKMVKSDIDPR